MRHDTEKPCRNDPQTYAAGQSVYEKGGPFCYLLPCFADIDGAKTVCLSTTQNFSSSIFRKTQWESDTRGCRGAAGCEASAIEDCRN